MSLAEALEQLAARLDRLPVRGFHQRFLGLISLGAWFDYYDNFIAGSLVTAEIRQNATAAYLPHSDKRKAQVE